MILPYIIFFILYAAGNYCRRLSSSCVFSQNTALRVLFSVSGAFLHLLGSWLLSLGIPGGCESWIVLTVYVKLFWFSLLVFYLSCRLPVLSSVVVKLWISAVFTEVESCSSVSITTWYQIFSICSLMPCCKTLSSVWALLMLWMSRTLIISQTFLHIIFFFLTLEIWQLLGHFILKQSKCL